MRANINLLERLDNSPHDQLLPLGQTQEISTLFISEDRDLESQIALCVRHGQELIDTINRKYGTNFDQEGWQQVLTEMINQLPASYNTRREVGSNILANIAYINGLLDVVVDDAPDVVSIAAHYEQLHRQLLGVCVRIDSGMGRRADVIAQLRTELKASGLLCFLEQLAHSATPEQHLLALIKQDPAICDLVLSRQHYMTSLAKLRDYHVFAAEVAIIGNMQERAEILGANDLAFYNANVSFLFDKPLELFVPIASFAEIMTLLQQHPFKAAVYLNNIPSLCAFVAGDDPLCSKDAFLLIVDYCFNMAALLLRQQDKLRILVAGPRPLCSLSEFLAVVKGNNIGMAQVLLNNAVRVYSLFSGPHPEAGCFLDEFVAMVESDPQRAEYLLRNNFALVRELANYRNPPASPWLLFSAITATYQTINYGISLLYNQYSQAERSPDPQIVYDDENDGGNENLVEATIVTQGDSARHCCLQ